MRDTASAWARQTDRGFSVAHVVDELVVPECVDLRTGAITVRTDRVHHFRCALACPCLPIRKISVSLLPWRVSGEAA